MALSKGDRLPEATFVEMGTEGPREVKLSERLKGRKVVVFGLPGAYTGPCTGIHIPSFVKTADAFRAKGVDEIICIAVNDPFVLKAWGESTGATAAGISFLGDADGSFTKTLGMEFTAPHLGLIGRSNRYALVLDDGVITAARVDKPGVCDISTGEHLLAEI
ncbi:peroxiredoxin [Defluviimonas sp. D31]|uniref:Glutathione-dependent peroxiredoxin n=1 Tax=Defluviimonas salinarum TaxID=2992147 RepID=A0ABT3J7L4_9RHOB|nr:MULTISPECIES: peroxiredoxin [Defluviimonas]MCW3783677.1 peroxiredoxin [Defluviimonas salinarum]MDW4551293.1 peroxiredoxin [Defluviimonas sp. D31]